MMLRETVQETVQKLDPTKKITFVGHSLGAVISVMSAFDHKTRDLKLKSKCVSFGMPKFACERFRKIITESEIPIISVKKANDPICHENFVPISSFQVIKYPFLTFQCKNNEKIISL